jgi:hypothetical protein
MARPRSRQANGPLQSAETQGDGSSVAGPWYSIRSFPWKNRSQASDAGL